MVKQKEEPIKYLQVPNWPEYQHYGKHRNPPWIKLHKRLLSDYAFNNLPDTAKAHVMLIWLLASDTDNKIQNDPKWIKAQIHAKKEIDLDLIIKSGFLEPYKGRQSLSAAIKGKR